MTYSNAIVTLAIGPKYLQAWKTYCEHNWRQYADQHGYDLLCIQEPLDTTLRAQQRSPAWQKCLILSQPFSEQYERVVWIDSDILINTGSSPNISTGVPIEKVGAVSMYEQPTSAVYRQVLDRMYEYWGPAAIMNYSPAEYHTAWGLPSGCSHVVQTGVLVLSPTHHRTLLEKTYYRYEEKGGREWHMEMRPLSYELLHAGVVHWLDGRFNTMWPEVLFLHYPFLLPSKHPLTLSARLKKRLLPILGSLSELDIRRAAINSTFLNSYFFHLGGAALTDLQLIDHDCTSFCQWIL